MTRVQLKTVLVAACLFLVASMGMGQTTSQVTVTGKVTDPDGKPVKGAFVNLSDPVTHQGAGAQTDSTGGYKFSIAPGAYTLDVSPPGDVPFLRIRRENVSVTANLTLDVKLERGAVLSGAVKDPDGKPVKDASVSLFAPPNQFYGAQSREDGRYYLVVRPGTYNLNVNPPQGSPFISTQMSGFAIQADTARDFALERGVFLSGKVTDPDGKPVKDVYVGVFNPTGGGGGNTDAEGNYKFPVRPGAYELNVNPPRGSPFIPERRSGLEVKGDLTLNISLKKGVTVSGVVRDPDGKRLQGTYVSLNVPQSNQGYGSGTDADGAYSIVVPPGVYNLYAGPPPDTPLLPLNKEGLSVTADLRLDLTLERGKILSGRVTDPEGKPVQNVYVNAWNPQTQTGGGGQTDADGRYRISLLPGAYNLNINPPQGSPFVPKNVQSYQVTGDQTLDIKLERGNILSGRVTDPDGRPAQGVNINLYNPQTQTSGFGQTDADGRYRISLLPGAYSVNIGLPQGSVFVSKNIQDYRLTGDQTLDIKLERGSILSGRVTDPDGKPVQNVYVNLHSPQTQMGGGGQTDADGRYRIALLPGTYSLNVSLPPGSPFVSKSIQDYRLTGDQTLDVKLERGNILSGRVTDPDGKPVQNVFVNAYSPQPGGPGGGGQTDADGRYRITLLPGTYNVSVGLPPGSPFVSKSIQDYRLTADQTLDIKLERGNILSGRVTDPDGKPVQNVNVNAWNPQTQTGGGGQTDAEGRYRIALLPGAYDLNVNPPQGTTFVNIRVERTNVFSDTVLDIKLERGSSLSGRVTDQAGHPLPDVNLNAFDPRTQTGSGARTGPDGKYTLVLKNGSYDLNVNPSPASLLVSKRLPDVKLEGDRTLDIVLERGVVLSGRMTDPDGKPVQNVYVNAWNPQTQTGAGAPTDADGQYRIALLPGVYNLNVNPPPGTPFARQDFNNLEVFKDRVLDARLEKGVVLSGNVQDRLGRPVSNVSVNAYSPQLNFGNGAQTDPDGRYRIVLKAGVYEVNVIPDPKSGLTRAVLSGVEVRADRTLDVPLKDGITLSGRVVGPKGGGVAGVNIDAQDDNFQNGSEGFAATDQDGAYTMTLPPNVYQLNVRPPEGTRFLQTQLYNVDVRADRRGFEVKLEEGFVLSGRVTDPDGKPVREAWVNVYDPAERFGTGDNTDPDGIYRVVVRRSVYALHVEPPRTLDVTSDLVSRDLLDVRVTDDLTLNIVLERGVFLSGRVTDRGGHPLPEVNVSASSNQGFGGGTQTDLDGRYRIALRPDTYFINVNPRPNTAYVPQRIERLEVKAGRTLDVVLEEGIVLSGRVTDADGNPVGQAYVQAGDQDKSDGDEGWTQTDRDGSYRIPLPAGVYDVTAQPPDGSGLLRATASAVRLTVPRTLNFQLTKGLILSGRVTAPDGQGLFDARISVFKPQTGEWYGTQTRRDGTYSLALPPGAYSLRAEPPQGSGFVVKEIREFEVKASQKLDLVFDRGVVLSGRITDPDGKPVPDAGVNASTASGENFGTGTRTDGTYSLALSPGVYDLNVYPRFGSDLISKNMQGVEVKADQKLDILLERGLALSGRVTDAKGNPVRQVNVHAEGKQGFGGGSPVDQDGRYRIPLRPGTYTIFFEPFGGRLVRKVVEQIEVNAPRTLDAVLDEGAAVSGKVTDPSGVEVADVSVNAFIGQEFRHVGGTRTFFDGTYSLALPPGTYNLAFEPSPGSPYVRQLLRDVKVEGDRKLDVTLTAGLVLSGKVTGPTGAGIAQAGVSARNVETEDSYGTGTDPDGNYRQTLPPGTYVIYVGPPPTSRLTFKEIKDVRVVANRTLDVQLEALIGLSGRVLDPDGKPVPFARLSAEAAGQTRGAGVDDKGLYTFPLPPGVYTIIVYPPLGSTLRLTRISNVNVVSDQTLDLKLERGIGLSGKVADATGKGLEKVGISLFNTATKEWVGTSTSTDGRYGIGLEAGTYEVNAVPFDPVSRFVQKRLTGVEVKADRTFDITLDQGFVVTGRVTDGAGNGIAHVGVNARDASGTAFGRGTDDKGSYSLALPAGTYTIEAYPPPGAGLIPKRIADVKVAGDLKLDVVLDRGVTLKGRVTDASGAGVDRVGVRAFKPETGEGYGGGTGIDGSYAIALPPGTYTVEFHPPEGRGLIRKEIPSVTLTADQALDVTLERGVVLSGRIVTPSGDRGVPDVEMVFILKGKGPVADAITDADGFYRAALAPGTYTVGYNPPPAKGYLPALVDSVDVNQTRTLDFKLEEGTALFGRVTGPGDVPVSGAILTAKNKKGEAFSSITSSDGLFRVVVPPGVYDVEVQPSAGSGLAAQKLPSVDTASGKPLDVQLAASTGPAGPVGAVKVTPSATALPADGTTTAVLSVTVTRPDGSLAAGDDTTAVALSVDGPASVKPGTVRVKGGVGSAVIAPTTVAGKIEVTAAVAGLAAGRATLTSFPATTEAESPTITVGPVVADITSTTAAVVWGTDRPSDGAVEYGTTPGLGTTVQDTAKTARHRVLLTDLRPSTVYQYRVTSGATRSRTLSFATGAPATENSKATLEIDLDPAPGNQRTTSRTGVKAGQTVEVVVYAKDLRNVAGFILDMDFDPNAILFVSAASATDAEKSLLATGGGNAVFLSPLVKGSSVRFGGSILAPAAGTVVSGDGLLGRFTFKTAEAFGAGRETKVTLTQAILRGLSASQQDTIRALAAATLSSGGPAEGGAGPIVLDLDLAPGDQGKRALSGVQPGAAFDVEIVATAGATGATGFSARMEFDPKKLTYVSFKEGDLIPTLKSLANPGDGVVEVGGAILGSGSGATKDSGTLTTVRFQVSSELTGAASLTLTSASIRKGSQQERFTLKTTVNIETVGGTGSKLVGDFDGNGEVSFDDFFLFASAFDTRKGDRGFDSKFDLDQNGEVDFGDFFLFADAFGQSSGAGKWAK